MTSSSGLFTPIFVPDPLREAVSDHAWLQAMLDAEAALAAAEARAGVIPVEAAEAIRACCRAGRFDPEALGHEGRAAGNPVKPLVSALSAAVGEDAARYVHWGATSQDVLDTAAMLVAKRALGLVVEEMTAVAAACAALAVEHRSTPMVARTLMQQALPTTFGLKAAGWLAGVAQARDALAHTREERPALQLGGAAGTLAALGDRGLDVIAYMAQELDLPAPALPWHTDRTRVAVIASALDLGAGALTKIALDVQLMAQTEVGEAAEPSGGGRGSSSAMPQKRNPVGSTIARANARRVHALTSLLTGTRAQEHERAAGPWHAEWQPLGEALALTGGAAFAMREVMEGLVVNTERMRANLALGGDALLAEHAVMVLAEQVGRPQARQVVDGALASGSSLREALAGHLSPEEIDSALDPAGYLGSAEAFVDRALKEYAR